MRENHVSFFKIFPIGTPMPSFFSPAAETRALVNGRWIEGRLGRHFSLVSPLHDHPIAEISDMTPEDGAEAIAHAYRAWKHWRRHPAKERSHFLQQWETQLRQHSLSLASFIRLETGKPLKEAEKEVDEACRWLAWCAQEVQRRETHTHGSTTIEEWQEPVGVVAGITPWCFPLAMAIEKSAAALAMGCAMVLKPARQAPISALAAAKLAQEAGLPPGILNILPTQNPIAMGELLCTHPDIAQISFTGNTETAKQLYTQSALQRKRLALETGSNTAFIVHACAKLPAAIQGAMQCKYQNAGQSGEAANRFFIHKTHYENFIKQAAQQSHRLKVGPQDHAHIGPLIHKQAVIRLLALIEDAKQQGARLICGGTTQGKSYLAPTVLADITADMRVVKEEIFGPIMAIQPFETLEEVIKKANETHSGIVYAYVEEATDQWMLAKELSYETLGINTVDIHEKRRKRKEGGRGLESFLTTKYINGIHNDNTQR